MDPVSRVIWFTCAWCFCPWMFLHDNRGIAVVRQRGSLWLGPDVKALIGQQLGRWEFLGAFHTFWKYWNPGVTTETTRQVYFLAGGSKRPLVATMLTFLYSGLFIHALNPLETWDILLFGLTPEHAEVIVFDVEVWLFLGATVVLAKVLGRGRAHV